MATRKCGEWKETCRTDSDDPRSAQPVAGAVGGRYGVAVPDVPNPALADLLDRVGQSVRGVVPVRLDGALRGARIALGDRRRDRVVFAHRRRQLIEQDVDVETRVALALRLDRAVQGDDARAGGILDIRLMKRDVEIEQPSGRRLGPRGAR